LLEVAVVPQDVLETHTAVLEVEQLEEVVVLAVVLTGKLQRVVRKLPGEQVQVLDLEQQEQPYKEEMAMELATTVAVAVAVTMVVPVVHKMVVVVVVLPMLEA
jgi:hypothetical protein